jgi:hypothetical protein
VIDRNFRPWRLVQDVWKGLVVGSLLHFFFMVTIAQSPTWPKPQMVLAALILFSTVFVGQFERYFPPIDEIKKKSSEDGKE